MTDNTQTPLEKAARALAADLGMQDAGHPFILEDDFTLSYIDQGGWTLSD